MSKYTSPKSQREGGGGQRQDGAGLEKRHFVGFTKVMMDLSSNFAMSSMSSALVLSLSLSVLTTSIISTKRITKVIDDNSDLSKKSEIWIISELTEPSLRERIKCHVLGTKVLHFEIVVEFLVLQVESLGECRVAELLADLNFQFLHKLKQLRG